GQRAHGVGMPARPPPNGHHGVAHDGKHLVGGAADPRNWRSWPCPGRYAAGIRVNATDRVDVAPTTAIAEVWRLIGMPGAHQPLDLRKRLIPFDPNLANRTLICPRITLVSNRLGLTRLEGLERLVERGHTLSNQALAQGAGGIAVEHLDAPLGQDRSGVDPRLRAVHGDPGLSVAVR